MSNNSDISNESKDIGGDIEIQDDQVNHFFFMDSDEEKKLTVLHQMQIWPCQAIFLRMLPNKK